MSIESHDFIGFRRVAQRLNEALDHAHAITLSHFLIAHSTDSDQIGLTGSIHALVLDHSRSITVRFIYDDKFDACERSTQHRLVGIKGKLALRYPGRVPDFFDRATPVSRDRDGFQFSAHGGDYRGNGRRAFGIAHQRFLRNHFRTRGRAHRGDSRGRSKPRPGRRAAGLSIDPGRGGVRRDLADPARFVESR